MKERHASEMRDLPSRYVEIGMGPSHVFCGGKTCKEHLIATWSQRPYPPPKLISWYCDKMDPESLQVLEPHYGKLPPPFSSKQAKIYISHNFIVGSEVR